MSGNISGHNQSQHSTPVNRSCNGAGAFVAPALLLIAGFLVFPALWTL
jgi:hypothetical protein